MTKKYEVVHRTNCKCGKKLFVPTWKYCPECTPGYKSSKIEDYGKIMPIRKREFIFAHNPWYKIRIPMVKYFFCETVLVDEEKKEIIGFK